MRITDLLTEDGILIGAAAGAATASSHHRATRRDVAHLLNTLDPQAIAPCPCI